MPRAFKKILVFILSFYVFFLCSCGDNKGQQKNLKEVMTKIKLEPCTADMRDITKDDFCAFSGTDSKDIKNFEGMISKKSSYFDEILLIEVSDFKNIDKVLKAMEENNKQKLSQAIMYDLSQKSVLEKRILFSKNNFIFSVISENSEKLKDIIVKNF